MLDDLEVGAQQMARVGRLHGLVQKALPKNLSNISSLGKKNILAGGQSKQGVEKHQ